MRSAALWIVVALALPAMAGAAPLTADDAVKLALQKNFSIIQGEANVLSARSGLWSAYSGVLPRVTGSIERDRLVSQPGSEFLNRRVFGTAYQQRTEKDETSSRSASINGTWNLFNLSSIQSWRSARAGMSAANAGQQATRNDVALLARERFYDVVKAYHLARVSSGSARLARDDERRVRALFEVGSVSKSDLLKAQVRTSQSQLDSLLADHGVITSRIQLSELLGMAEGSLGDVDTSLTSATAPEPAPDMATLLTEAKRARPDLRAADLRVRSAQQALSSAQLARMPYLASSGAYSFKSHSTNDNSTRYLGFPFYPAADTTVTNSTTTDSDPNYRLSLSVNLDLFDGFATDSRIASARSRLIIERETRDALLRNLDSEVRQELLGYQEAIERETLSRRALASAQENLNLVQQKYNVGSATILDLIDSQVQLQRAESDLVSSLAAIRVAHASIERVRGKGE